MKKNLSLLLLLALVTCTAWAQPASLPSSVQEIPPSPLKFRPYYVANLELLGPVMYAASIPGQFRFRQIPFWPAWVVGGLEIGVSPKSSVVIGGGFRYARVKLSDFPRSYYFRDASLTGAKALIGYRHYFGKGDGNGLFLQPTGKFVWNHYNEYSSAMQAEGSFRDYMFTLRFGMQKRIYKNLNLTASVGPGLGFRYDLWERRYNFLDLWHTDLDEIDYTDLRIIDSYGLNNFTMSLIGDANLALSWRF
jgi:hypothetical protein